jgi:hypothetical protein
LAENEATLNESAAQNMMRGSFLSCAAEQLIAAERGQQACHQTSSRSGRMLLAAPAEFGRYAAPLFK